MQESKNFSYSSLGNAKLKKEKKSIQIENSENCILSGIAINTKGIESHQFELKGLTVNKENSVNISNFGLDGLGRLKCIAQQSFYYSPKHDGVMYALNSKMLPKRVSIIGKINGKIVFKRDYLTPKKNEEINWWPIVVGAIGLGKYILDHVCYKSPKIEYYENGNLKSSEGGFNWNGIDPDNENNDKISQYMTYDGIKFIADDIYVLFEEEKNNCIPQSKLAEIQITTNNKKFEIFS